MPLQQVHIGKTNLDSIFIEKDEIEIPLKPGEEEILEINFINHGIPTHLYISVSDDLKDIIQIENPNPYVRFDLTVPIKVSLPEDKRFVKGKVIITSGYGRVQEDFILMVGVRELREKRHVEVDKTLTTHVIKKKPSISFPVVLLTAIIFVLSFVFTVIFPLMSFMYGAVIMSVALTFGVTYSILKLLEV